MPFSSIGWPRELGSEGGLRGKIMAGLVCQRPLDCAGFRVSRLLLGVGEGVEGLVDQVGQFGGSVVFDPGEHGGARGGQAGRDGYPGLEAGVRVELVCMEGLEDGLLGGELACPLAFAERWGGDYELDLREQGV